MFDPDTDEQTRLEFFPRFQDNWRRCERCKCAFQLYTEATPLCDRCRNPKGRKRRR